jgi:hypothetical protein
MQVFAQQVVAALKSPQWLRILRLPRLNEFSSGVVDALLRLLSPNVLLLPAPCSTHACCAHVERTFME